MVRTRNQGASPGGFQSLDSPFFKRTRKLPKSKKQLEEESAAEAAGVSVETIRQESVVYYHSPNTTSPSPPPPAEASALISRSELESPPSPVTMSVIESEPQPKKQPASRMSESVQEPSPTPSSQPVTHTKDNPRTISAVTERMNKPKMQVKKPKMVLSSFPSYEEDMESDDELMEELQDRSKFSASVGRKSARSYLDAEQRKEIQARMAGKPYVASTPIKNPAHKKKSAEGPSSRKSTALQILKSPLTIPYVQFFTPGQEPIILTNPRILDILHAVADWATRDPSSLPDAEQVVARLEAPKSSGLAAIMPVNHTVEESVDTDSPMGNPSDFVVTTYAQPDTASEGENSDDDMKNSDEDEPMAESNSEVAISPLPETSKASEKSTYHGWGLLSAVKSIVSTPIKLFGSSQHTAKTTTTNSQELDLNFQSMKTNRINNRVATPKSATARRTLQSIKAKTSQSERKPLSKEAPWVPMHQRGAAEVSLAMEKAKKEFRKQQQKKKAAQRKEAEENDNLHHIDNHQGTFKAPEYDSDSTEEDEPESPLVRKIAQPKKTVTWSDQTPMPGRFTSFEEEGELYKYGNINVNPNPFTQARANATSVSTSPGLWVLQNQWAEEGKSVEECAALEAEFLRKEEANKTAWRNQAAANRAEARERQMALERMERNEREKNEQARQAAVGGKTINGSSKWNRDSYSVNETHHSNETNPDYSSFEATSNTSSIWDGTNPDTSSVNETVSDNQPSVDQFSARKTKYMNMVADNYFSGRDLSKSPYIDQKINPFAEGVWSQEDRAKYQSPSKVQQEKEESTRETEEQSQTQEETTVPSSNQPFGELQNLPTVLEHPSVSAAKATATKYSPKKPSTLRHVEMASPTHSDRMSSQEKENKVVEDLYSRDHLNSQASLILGRFGEPAGTSLPLVPDPDMVQHLLDEATKATYDMLNTPEADAVNKMVDSLPYTAFTAFTAEYTPLFT